MVFHDIHAAWAWFVVIGNGAAGAWSLGAHVRPSLRTRWLWIATAIVQASVFVQTLLGVAAYQEEHLQPDAVDFHILYGATALLSVGVLYGYRHQLADKLHLLYGLGGLWIMGLGIRAMVLHL